MASWPPPNFPFRPNEVPAPLVPWSHLPFNPPVPIPKVPPPHMPMMYGGTLPLRIEPPLELRPHNVVRSQWPRLPLPRHEVAPPMPVVLPPPQMINYGPPPTNQMPNPMFPNIPRQDFVMPPNPPHPNLAGSTTYNPITRNFTSDINSCDNSNPEDRDISFQENRSTRLPSPRNDQESNNDRRNNLLSSRRNVWREDERGHRKRSASPHRSSRSDKPRRGNSPKKDCHGRKRESGREDDRKESSHSRNEYQPDQESQRSPNLKHGHDDKHKQSSKRHHDSRKSDYDSDVKRSRHDSRGNQEASEDHDRIRSSRQRNTHSRTYSSSSQRNERWSNDEQRLQDRKRRSSIKISSRVVSKPPDKSEPLPEVTLSTQTFTWFRSSPAEEHYIIDDENPNLIRGSETTAELHKTFRYELVERASRVKATKPQYVPPQRKTKLRKPKPPRMEDDSTSSSSEESSSEEEDTALEELEKKKKHPDRLHDELWYNDPGEMNDGPLCRCSAKARRSGIRHGMYAGEEPLLLCNNNSNNADKLYHYRITMSPDTNFLSKCPTVIRHDNNDYVFEGFSMFSHSPIPDLPSCKVIRFNIEYTVLYVQEKFPQNFTVEGLELFSEYLLKELLELVDLNWKAYGDNSGCPRFHFMPRFARPIENEGKELLSMNVVLQYLLDNNRLLIDEKDLVDIMALRQHKWQDFADKVKGMIVTCPGLKPSSIRVDQLDREQCNDKKIFPEIIHFGVRPPQLSYAGNPDYQKAWREYVKFRHLLANKPKVVYADRHQLLQKERRLQEMRMKNNLKRDVTVVICSKNFYKTGIMCDVVQHAMLLPVLVCHLRFHQSLDILEERTGYKFADRYLLQLALTHPSYRENFGTNPDHARNSLTNCGIRQPEYGDRRIHYMNTRKRGINTLINIMSRFGRREETLSRINHNERLEFLGDAVVEFLSSIHLFFMFPSLEEGGLATYRAAIVQNQHLAVLSKKLQLEKFMLYAHGSDLCHDLELRHAMANCFEALMGALFLDSGIEVADKVFSETLFTEPELLDVWVNYPPHPLQEQEPGGDRKWLSLVPLLQHLHEFEEAIGIEFTHIRLLARALTHRSLGFNNLTMGSNQRLEFLGDTVLQLVASEYLYKFFPEHHEGHLSLLRSSLVNNRTQAVVCADLGMVEYAIYSRTKVELKTKDRADLLEAFLGALYVDKNLAYCTKFCEVCFFPRLQDFIMNQEWNDPKSKLQQCCLTLRTMDGGEPDIPLYKVIECKGPTNTRVYTVAVYFRTRRLAVGSGHSIQQAEMAAAENALNASKELFPQLDHQRRAIQKSLKQGVPPGGKGSSSKRRRPKRNHKRKS